MGKDHSNTRQDIPVSAVPPDNPDSSSKNGERPNPPHKDPLQCLLQNPQAWPFGEAALTELIVLRQEQERTRQEQTRLSALDRTLQVLQQSIDAHIPSHLIPSLFGGAHGVPVSGDSSLQQHVRPQHRPAVAAANAAMASSGLLGSRRRSPPGHSAANSISLDTSFSANSTFMSLAGQPPSVLPDKPARNLPIQSSFDAAGTGFPSARRHPHHQRSSTISSTKELYAQNSGYQRDSPYEPLSSAYITHGSPFMFPTKLNSTTIPEAQTVSFSTSSASAQPVLQPHAPIAASSDTGSNPNSPSRASCVAAPSLSRSPKRPPQTAPQPKPSIPTNDKNEPVDISSFQHVIQFHHWQAEDPAAMIRKEQQRSKETSKEAPSQGGHSRRRSNPELAFALSSSALSRSRSIDNKVTKPGHTRTRSSSKIHISSPLKTKKATATTTTTTAAAGSSRGTFSAASSQSSAIATSTPDTSMADLNDTTVAPVPGSKEPSETSDDDRGNTSSAGQKGNILTRTRRKMFSHGRTRSEALASLSAPAKFRDDFFRFQVGKSSILNADEGADVRLDARTGGGAREGSDVENSEGDKRGFNPLSSLASAALMDDEKQQKSLKEKK